WRALREQGRGGVRPAADRTREAEADAAVDCLLAVTGRLDILVNNAGSPIRLAPLEHCPTDLWRQAFDVNVPSAFFVPRRAIPPLRASGHGSIINNLSLSVQTGGAGGGGAPWRPQGAPPGVAAPPAPPG